MYAVSNGYKEVIYSGDSDNRLKLLFNGVEYETVNVKSEKLTVTSRILSNGNDRFSLDNFVSKEAELIIHDIDLEDIIEPIDISIGTLVNNEYEYVPIGVFNLVEIPTTDSKKTTIKLRDNSVKFDIPYNAEEIINENGGSATILQILQDICTKCNVELGTTEFVNKDTRVSVWDNSINARQYVMDIAEKAGCIATIDRLGKLILIDLQGGEAVEKISENNTIYINDALPRKLLDLELNGNTQQDGTPTPDSPIEIENVTGRQNIEVCGKNLFDFTDIKEQSTGITTDDDGWITVVGDNSSGSSTLFKNYYTNKTDRLKPSTTYKVICEIKEKTGNIRDLTITSNATASQSNTTNTIPNADATNNTIIVRNFTTKSDFSNCTIMLRSYVAFASGNSGSITFRLSVVEDTSITPETFVYESYKGKSYEVNLGKNLLNASQESYTLPANENNSQIFGQVYLEKNIKYYISFDIENDSTSNTRSTIYLQIGNGTRIYQDSGTNKNLTKGRKVWEYTPTQSAIYNVGYWLHTSNVEVTISNYMVSKSSDTEYTPYFTPIELNKIGNYQDKIYKTSGKNLFNNNGTMYQSTGATVETIDTGIRATVLQTGNNKFGKVVIPNSDELLGKTVTLSAKISPSASNTGRIALYQISSTGGTISSIGMLGNTGSTTLTIPSEYSTNAVALALLFYANTSGTSQVNDYVDYTNVQLEKGSTKSPYEPYGSIGKWYLEKQTSKVVLNGSEAWTKASEGFYLSNTIFDNITNNNCLSKSALYSNYYKNYTTSTTLMAEDYGIGIIYNVKNLYIRNNDISTANDFKTWLNTHNTIVYYQLITPEYTEITNEELINQLESIKLLEGTNNITITSEDLASPLKITYQQEKQPIELNPLLFESYKEGEEIKVSRVVYEDAIRKFTAGNEDEATLYINSANHYITNQEEIDNIYNVINGLEMHSMNISKMIGNPAIDAWDMLQFTYNNKTYKFLGQNTLTYTKNMIQSFDTQIGTNAKSQENVTFNSDESRFKRVFTRIDQAEGNIELNTSQIQTVQSDLQQNYYNLEQTNQLIQNATTGITNTFSEAGGNNIFRNTGLWFQDNSNRDLIYPSLDLYPSNDLFSGKEPVYEYWTGNVEKMSEDRAANQTALLLQEDMLGQRQEVPNGIYTISFKYQKLLELANIKCIINDIEYLLPETTETEFVQTIEVKSQYISVNFESDVNNSCEIYDLMVNAGSVKLAYSQNQNETTTDTVNISKGITITSSDTDTTFKANSDGVRIYDSKDLNLPKTKFTDKGTETDYLKAKNEAEIVDILIQRVGSHTWLTKI